MSMISKLAWANTKYHKGKNLLSGIAIILTTVLVFLIITLGLGVVNTQNHVVNKIYPTWHTMYREVTEEKKDQLIQHADIETYGLRQDVGTGTVGEDGSIFIAYIDQEGEKLNKLSYLEGSNPEKENESALSRGALKALGYPNAEIGDEITVPYQPFEKTGLGVTKEQVFKVSGIMPDAKDSEKQKMFSMLISKNFMENVIPAADRSYRVMIRLSANVGSSVDEIEAAGEAIGASFDILSGDIVMNSDYLFANYVDPNFAAGMAIIVLIIVIAGALTIYSIYYVSLINKVQEFGKLKALGATKRQVRQAVLRENLLVAAVAIPAGLLLAIGCAKVFFNQMMITALSGQDTLAVTKAALENGEVQIILPWVVLLTIAVSFGTVLVSSLKPMRQASKIMPIEAMRYTGQAEKKTKKRKGFIDLTLGKLAGANLTRNKKRTFITIFSLGLIGVLFMVVSTVFNCMQPEQIARDSMAKDFEMSIESWTGDKMHPEREWTEIQKNNPLNSDFEDKISAISGVKKVTEHLYISGEIPGLKDSYTEGPLSLGIHGVDEEKLNQLEKKLTSGSVDLKKMAKGEQVIATDNFARRYPEVKTGDKFVFTLFDGDKKIEKEVTIAAFGLFTQAEDHYSNFIMTNDALKNMSEHNLAYSYDIEAAPDKLNEVEKELSELKKQSEFLQLESYEKVLNQWQTSMLIMLSAGYGILAVLGIVGIMNLVNTTIDSILTRKKELGVMQAIGMSNQQMNRMLQTEGLIYTAGITGFAVGLGSLLGYVVYLYAAENQLMQIKTYHYPFLQAALLIGVVLIVQLTLTIITTKLVNRETVINRIRAAE